MQSRLQKSPFSFSRVFLFWRGSDMNNRRHHHRRRARDGLGGPCRAESRPGRPKASESARCQHRQNNIPRIVEVLFVFYTTPNKVRVSFVHYECTVDSHDGIRVGFLFFFFLFLLKFGSSVSWGINIRYVWYSSYIIFIFIFIIIIIIISRYVPTVYILYYYYYYNIGPGAVVSTAGKTDEQEHGNAMTCSKSVTFRGRTMTRSPSHYLCIRSRARVCVSSMTIYAIAHATTQTKQNEKIHTHKRQ